MVIYGILWYKMVVYIHGSTVQCSTWMYIMVVPHSHPEVWVLACWKSSLQQPLKRPQAHRKSVLTAGVQPFVFLCCVTMSSQFHAQILDVLDEILLSLRKGTKFKGDLVWRGHLQPKRGETQLGLWRMDTNMELGMS